MTGTLELPDLCVPETGSTTLHTVLSGALRRALGDLKSILRMHASGPWATDVAQVVRGVGPLVRHQPGAIVSALRRTEVGVWLRCLRPSATAPVPPATGVPALLAGLALELARQRSLPGPLRLRAWPKQLSSSAGRLWFEVPPDADEVVFESGRVTAITSRGPVALPLHASDEAHVALTGTEVRLSLHDDNPLAALEAHPDKTGNALDLGGQPVRRWTEALEHALAIVGEHLPALRAEFELVLQRVVPVGWDQERHFSASMQESIGTIYLSLHPNPMTMAEAVIHEVSHNKLAALFELDPVLHNVDAPGHASPVRPDPRPLRGVLLAVHAFLPVAALYMKMIDAGSPGSEHLDFRRRFAQVVEGNHEGAKTLEAQAQPTALGQQLLDEIARLDRRGVERLGG